MSTETLEPAKPINDVEIGEEAETVITRKPESVFLKRRKRRRLDLRTLAGTARESAKIYRQFAEGEMSAGELEARSRHLRRHSEILTTIEQKAQLTAIQEQLEAIRRESIPIALPANPSGLDEVPQ